MLIFDPRKCCMLDELMPVITFVCLPHLTASELDERASFVKRSSLHVDIYKLVFTQITKMYISVCFTCQLLSYSWSSL